MTHLESNDPWLTRRGFLGGAAGLSFAVAFGADGLSLMSAAEAKAKARNVGAWVRTRWRLDPCFIVAHTRALSDVRAAGADVMPTDFG